MGDVEEAGDVAWRVHDIEYFEVSIDVLKHGRMRKLLLSHLRYEGGISPQQHTDPAWDEAWAFRDC